MNLIDHAQVETMRPGYDYDAFGNEKNPSATDDNPFRYCAEYFDKETGTYYLRARYYDPSIGRFTQQDSVQYTEKSLPTGNIIDHLSLNYYTYSANNPVLYCDPSGNAWETVFDVLGIIWSANDFYNNPSWKNAGYLAWDIGATIIPFVPGSYTTKLTKGIKLFNRFDDFADTAKAVNVADNIIDGAKVATINGQAIVAPYKELKKIVSSQGLEVHHLIEKRFASALGIENTNEMLSIAIDKDFHRNLTNDMRKIIGYKGDGTGSTTYTAKPQEIWDMIVAVYEKYGMEEYLTPIKEQLQEISKKVNDVKWGKY